MELVVKLSVQDFPAGFDHFVRTLALQVSEHLKSHIDSMLAAPMNAPSQPMKELSEEAVTTLAKQIMFRMNEQGESEYKSRTGFAPAQPNDPREVHGPGAAAPGVSVPVPSDIPREVMPTYQEFKPVLSESDNPSDPLNAPEDATVSARKQALASHQDMLAKNPLETRHPVSSTESMIIKDQPKKPRI